MKHFTIHTSRFSVTYQANDMLDAVKQFTNNSTEEILKVELKEKLKQCNK